MITTCAIFAVKAIANCCESGYQCYYEGSTGDSWQGRDQFRDMLMRFWELEGVRNSGVMETSNGGSFGILVLRDVRLVRQAPFLKLGEYS